VIAESYERIHRSNLVGMGVLPLQFAQGESVESLGLTGTESFDVKDLGEASVRETEVTARSDDGAETTFKVTVRIDTPQEWLYYRHGGILQFVLRQLLAGREAA
jgi:aconitate hydratase